MIEYRTIIIVLIITFVVLLIIALVIREVMLWYWRINLIIRNQERTNELLEVQNSILLSNQVLTTKVNSDYEKWKQANPSKSLNEFYAERGK